MRRRVSLLVSLLLPLLGFLVTTSPVQSHRGGLDSYGCHHDRKKGGYHCHRGPFAGQSFASRQEMRGALMRLRSPQPEAQQQEGTSDLTPQPSPPGHERACIREERTKQIVCGDVVRQAEPSGSE